MSLTNHGNGRPRSFCKEISAASAEIHIDPNTSATRLEVAQVSLAADESLHDKQPSRSVNAAPSTVSQFITYLKSLLLNLWLFTKDDTPTFVIPNTIFGLSSALCGAHLITHTASPATILARTPWVLLFNWTNLLVFDLANQRLPESIREDTLNKPWRPVPSGRLTSTQVRRSMLVAIPLVLLVNHAGLGVGTETALLYVLTWLYNDLRGGDEHWVIRNVIIALAFSLYNLGSAKVAAGQRPGWSVNADTAADVHVTHHGYIWTAIISAVILTTMHVQDLKDQAGDRSRGRRTAPLVLGDGPARWTLAVLTFLWAPLCARFWDLGLLETAPPAVLGAYVARRCLLLRGKRADRRTWQLWCLWTALLYIMPLVRCSIGTENAASTGGTEVVTERSL